MKKNEQVSFDPSLILVKKTKELSFIDGNQAVLKLGGYRSLDSFIGLTDADCPWSNNVEHYRAHEKDALAGNIYPALQPTMDVNQHVHWLYNYKYPVYNEAGQFQYLQVVAHDVKCAHFLNFINTLYCNECYDIQQYYINKLTDENLTQKESKVLFFLLRGKTAKEIAQQMQLSYRTIEYHINNIKKKFKCATKSQIIDYAVSKGYVHIVPTFLNPNRS